MNIRGLLHTSKVTSRAQPTREIGVWNEGMIVRYIKLE